MSKLLYFLATFAESGLSVFGIRATYEQPAYQVVQRISPSIEIRHYAPRTAVEAPILQGNEGEAFGRLFRYITGANATERTVPMTVPVERSQQMIAMTVPVETGQAAQTMRFFLPESVVASGVPAPTDPRLRIVSLPDIVLAVIQYSGTATPAARDLQTARLRRALGQAGKVAEGAPLYFSYDPPFTIPFLRRNEVALHLTGQINPTR